MRLIFKVSIHSPGTNSLLVAEHGASSSAIYLKLSRVKIEKQIGSRSTMSMKCARGSSEVFETGYVMESDAIV